MKAKIKKILEFYYMAEQEVKVKDLAAAIKSVEPEKIDIWSELDLMEVVLDDDSLIFQNAGECFVDPLDLQFFEEHQIKKKYQISFAESDTIKAKKVLEELMVEKGGIVCSDTDDFQPLSRPDRNQTVHWAF